MPVRRFRSVEAMEDASWREPGVPETARAIAAVWSLDNTATPGVG